MTVKTCKSGTENQTETSTFSLAFKREAATYEVVKLSPLLVDEDSWMQPEQNLTICSW